MSVQNLLNEHLVSFRNLLPVVEPRFARMQPGTRTTTRLTLQRPCLEERLFRLLAGGIIGADQQIVAIGNSNLQKTNGDPGAVADNPDRILTVRNREPGGAT
jgi:hypothetical protein